MQVSVEKVSNVLRRLDFVVPAQQVENAYSSEINALAKTAKLDGFRPGKAPLSHIKKYYGEQVRREAINKVIQNCLVDAIKKEQLRPISEPEVQPKTLLADQPLEFSISFEVLPEIHEINFKMTEVEKLEVNVTDADVERVINQLQKQYTQWKQVNRAATNGDRVVINYLPIFADKAEEDRKVENYPLELGSGVMLPGFEAALVGCQIGEEKTIDLTFPEDFHDKDKAGKPVQFKVTVNQILEADQPELNQEFLTKLGIKNGDLAELQKQIRDSLEQERDRLVKENLKEQVFKHLLEENALDVPRSMVEREAGAIHDEMYPNHQHHDHSGHSPQETAMFQEIAKKRVALGLLIGEYAKQQDIKVDNSRVQQRIKEIAAAYEQPQEVVAWLSAPERKAGIESQVMEDQVMDKLLTDLTVKTKTMTYAELKGVKL